MNDFAHLIQQWVFDPNLDPVECRLLCRLAYHIQRRDRRPSKAQLVEEIKCSEREWEKAIAGLIKLGKLSRTKVSYGWNRGSYYTYHLDSEVEAVVKSLEIAFDRASSSSLKALSPIQTTTSLARSKAGFPLLTEETRKPRTLLTVAILRENGIWEKSIPELLTKKWNTFDYIEAAINLVRKSNARTPTSLLYTILKGGNPIEKRYWKEKQCWRCFDNIAPGVTCPECGKTGPVISIEAPAKEKDSLRKEATNE
jgi:hypothetical protein